MEQVSVYAWMGWNYNALRLLPPTPHARSGKSEVIKEKMQVTGKILLQCYRKVLNCIHFENKGTLGRSSTPKRIWGTTESVWAGEVHLPTHHNMISPHINVLQGDKIDKETSPGYNVDLVIPNLIPGSKIRPRAWKHKRCALRNHAEPRPQTCKSSH